MTKKCLSLILSIVIAMVSCFSFSLFSYGKSYEDQLKEEGFNSSYINMLVKLHKKYPNWSFKAIKTNMDWQNAVDGERSSHSSQIIHKASAPNSAYFCDCSSCYVNGSYVYREGSYVSASESAVKYYMDPRNWLNEKGIFQFESMKYSSDQNASGVEAIISGTFMHNSNISYTDSKGSVVTYTDDNDKNVKFSKAILNAGKDSGVSPYYLSAKIVQEVGSTKQNVGGTCGTREPFKSIFNYYNIGAYSGASDGLHWANGMLWAKKDTILYSKYDSKFKTVGGTETAVPKNHYMAYIGTYGDYLKVKLYVKKGGNSYSTDGKTGYILKSKTDYSELSYGRPWTNPYKSIYYGAQYIANGYLKYQYTQYLQKFNVNPDSPYIHSHEYMTNVSGAAAESELAYRSAQKADILSSKKTFYIPVYKNMPFKASPKPEKAVENDDANISVDPEPVVNPDKVKGLKVTKTEKESIGISWDKVSKASKYDIYLQNASTGNVYHKEVGTNSASLNNLTQANSYNIKVRAYKNSKYCEYSDVITAHTQPAKVAGLKLSSTGSQFLKFKWDKVSGATKYDVYYKDSSTGKVSHKYVTKNSVKISSLSPNRIYSVKVRAYKSVYGAYSNAVKQVTKPQTPAIKAPSTNSKHQIIVKWKSVSCSGYEVQYSKKKDFSNVIATRSVEKSKTSYTGNNFTKGNSYYVRVRSYRTYNSKKYYSPWSSVKKIVSK